MDPGVRIYASLLNSIVSHLSRVNPELSKSIVGSKTQVLKAAGVKYTVDRGILGVEYATEESRGIFYKLVLDYILEFEMEYGVNQVWIPLKAIIIKVLQSNRDALREIGLEFPIAKYQLDYVIFDNLFGSGTSDFRNRRWTNGTALVTNHALTLVGDDKENRIPLNSIATVDREIYIGYSSEVTRGDIRAIDYKNDVTGMSSVVLLAKKDIMNDFMRVVSIVRTEHRRLTKSESNVLIALYNGVAISDLMKALNMSRDDVNKSFNRLLEIGYTDQRGHLTSFGINASIALMQTMKQ